METQEILGRKFYRVQSPEPSDYLLKPDLEYWPFRPKKKSKFGDCKPRNVQVEKFMDPFWLLPTEIWCKNWRSRPKKKFKFDDWKPRKVQVKRFMDPSEYLLKADVEYLAIQAPKRV